MSMPSILATFAFFFLSVAHAGSFSSSIGVSDANGWSVCEETMTEYRPMLIPLDEVEGALDEVEDLFDGSATHVDWDEEVQAEGTMVMIWVTTMTMDCTPDVQDAHFGNWLGAYQEAVTQPVWKGGVTVR